MKRLTVNGDDFGMNERCSRAIARAFDEGMITDTTMMANGAYFDEAVALAGERGFSDKIGIHFNITEGEPLTEAIKDLPAFVSDGRFHKQYLKRPYPLSGDESDAVYRELCAQIERIRSAGISVTHADSHHYIHNDSYLAPIVARVCREYGINKIRLNRTFDTAQRPRVTENRIENSWWREQGFMTTAHFGRLADVKEIAVPDSTEIMVHPDLDREGCLIDRTGMTGGFATGERLYALRDIPDVILCGYCDLS